MPRLNLRRLGTVPEAAHTLGVWQNIRQVAGGELQRRLSHWSVWTGPGVRRGFCQWRQARIVVPERQPSVLLHEVAHALMWELGYAEKEPTHGRRFRWLNRLLGGARYFNSRTMTAIPYPEEDDVR